MRARSFLIDGEMVVADQVGRAAFDLVRGRAKAPAAFVWVFDLIESQGTAPLVEIAGTSPAMTGLDQVERNIL